MATFEERRALVLEAAYFPLQRQILGRMERLVLHKGNPNHLGDHVTDFDLQCAIGATLTEAMILYGLVRQSPQQAYCYWEIGSYVGWTTAFIAEAVRKRKPLPGIVHTFDSWEDDPVKLERRFQENTLYWTPIIRHHGGTTPSSFDEVPAPDWVFVDGGHHGGQPIEDVEGVLKKTGTAPVDFVLHDVWIPDVQDAVDLLESKGFQLHTFKTPNQLTLATKDGKYLDTARRVAQLHEEDLAEGGSPWR